MLKRKNTVQVSRPNTKLTSVIDNSSRSSLCALRTEAHPMIHLLKKICTIQQPGSLSNTYFYQFSRPNRYRLSKLISHTIKILNIFFGTFYVIISKPVFLFNQKKLVIYINYYIPKTSKKLLNRYL
jgi:hypothetical protein